MLLLREIPFDLPRFIDPHARCLEERGKTVVTLSVRSLLRVMRFRGRRVGFSTGSTRAPWLLIEVNAIVHRHSVRIAYPWQYVCLSVRNGQGRKGSRDGRDTSGNAIREEPGHSSSARIAGPTGYLQWPILYNIWRRACSALASWSIVLFSISSFLWRSAASVFSGSTVIK